jgi:predicted transcriptional regulator
MPGRRERWTILGEVLDALQHERAGMGDGARLTIVAQRANLPYDRLITYLEELAERGLVTPDRPPRITPQGVEFLSHYTQWRAILGRFGLE